MAENAMQDVQTILRIGYCYGYPLDQARDRRYVLGVLVAATSGSLATRRERLGQLREIEDWLLEETQQDVVAQELASLLFQLGIFEDVPGVGAISGALLNLAFIRRIDITARRVFQERWLRDIGKVDEIAPAESHARDIATGWSGAMARVTYSGCYYIGFSATLPVWFVVSLARPMDNPLTRGIQDGATAANDGVDRFLGWARRGARRSAVKPDGIPALAPT